MPKTVLINHVYSYLNRGDSAIVESMAHFLEEKYGPLRIVMLSRFYETNRDYYEQFGWKSAPPLWTTPVRKNKVLLLREALTRLGRIVVAYATGSTVSLTDEQREAVELYKEADLILDAGGGSLYSSNKYPIYLDLYQHLFNLYAAKKLGKPVVIAPQSIGPLPRWHDRQVTMSLLRDVDHVLVREQVSERLLQAHDVKCTLTPDIAFLGNYVGTPSVRARAMAESFGQARQNVGVTVLNWSWSADSRADSEAAIQHYLMKIASAVETLPDDTNVWVFPQVTAGHGDSDLPVSKRLEDLGSKRVRVLDARLPASDLTWLYGQMDAFVGSRMHSCIFAITQGVPTIGLAYQPKTLGTYSLLGLSKLAVDIETFSEHWLADQLKDILSRPTHWTRRFQGAARIAKRDVETSYRRATSPFLLT